MHSLSAVCIADVHVRVGMELGWGGFDRAKLDMLILIRIPFSFHVGLFRTAMHCCCVVHLALLTTLLIKTVLASHEDIINFLPCTPLTQQLDSAP